MEQVVTAILDKKVSAFLKPVFLRTLEEAKRAFMHSVSDEKSELNQWPDDFSLYHLGFYDDNTGKFKNLNDPEELVSGRMALTLYKDYISKINVEEDKQ